MQSDERERFDALLAEAIEALPEHLRALIEEVPIIVEDEPAPTLIRELAAGLTEEDAQALPDELCGLHTGVPITERSVEHTDLPTDIRLFRRGIINLAGGWDAQEGEDPTDAEDAIYEEIMVTLLHEIGHHFGLDEEDLEGLGFG